VTLDAVLRGEYQNWDGLVPEPTLEEFAARVGAAMIHAPQRRDRIATRYSVYAIERAAPPARLEAWSPTGTRRISIVEIDDPVCPDVEPVLDAMGEPEIRLEGARLSADYLVSEFVFAQRGIVLSIGAPLTPQVSRRRMLLHIRLFPPVTLQRYLTDIGESNPSRPTVQD
jgi:hypothetical protein